MALILISRIYPCQLQSLRSGQVIDSNDDPHYDVSGFLQRNGLPAPTPFRSVACYSNAVPPRCYAKLYGPVVLTLNVNAVIADMVLAAPDDIQDAVVAASPARLVDLTQHLAPVPRTDVLERFVTAYYATRSAKKYVEGRLGRALAMSDVSGIDDSAVDLFGAWQSHWNAHNNCAACAADMARRAGISS
jgi:hypothetical protein